MLFACYYLAMIKSLNYFASIFIFYTFTHFALVSLPLDLPLVVSLPLALPSGSIFASGFASDSIFASGFASGSIFASGFASDSIFAFGSILCLWYICNLCLPTKKLQHIVIKTKSWHQSFRTTARKPPTAIPLGTCFSSIRTK